MSGDAIHVRGVVARRLWCGGCALALLLLLPACPLSGPMTYTSPNFPVPASAGLAPEVGELRAFGWYTRAVGSSGVLLPASTPAESLPTRAFDDDIALFSRHELGAAVVWRLMEPLTLSLDVGVSRTNWTRPAPGEQARALPRRTLSTWRPGGRLDVPLRRERLALALLVTAQFNPMFGRQDDCDRSSSCQRLDQTPVALLVAGPQFGASPLPWLHLWTFAGVGPGFTGYMNSDVAGEYAPYRADRPPNSGRERGHITGMVVVGADVRHEHFYASVASQFMIARAGFPRPFHALLFRVGGQFPVGRGRADR